MNLPVLQLLQLAILLRCVRGEIFTAMVDLRKRFEQERETMKSLREYLKHEGYQFDEMRRISANYVSLADLTPGEFTENPLHSYRLVEFLSEGLHRLRSLVGDKEIAKQLDEIHLVDKVDLPGVIEGLFRIQDVYELDAEDIVEGTTGIIQGGLPLTTRDCVTIGSFAYKRNDTYHTIIWLYQAIIRAGLESKPTADTRSILPTFADALERQGNPERALTFLEMALKYDPDNEDIMRSIIDLEDRLSTVNIPPTRPLPPLFNKRTAHLGTSGAEEYERLCRESNDEKLSSDQRLICYYKSEANDFKAIAPFKVEVLHVEPTIVVFRGVISDAEIDELKKLSYPKMKRAEVVEVDKFEVSEFRTSKSGWLEDDFNYLTERLTTRMRSMTGLSQKSAELFQIATYGIAGHYDPHMDFSEELGVDAFRDGYGNRIATLMFYLSDVKIGGATAFPELGIAVPPTKNDAVFWYNLLPSGAVDRRTLHGACPVAAGEKWVANRWLREEGQEFLRPCETDQDAGS